MDDPGGKKQHPGQEVPREIVEIVVERPHMAPPLGISADRLAEERVVKVFPATLQYGREIPAENNG